MRASTRYPGIREALSTRFQNASDARVEQLVRENFGEVEADDVENFFRSIGNFARQALPVVGTIARTALPIVGTAFGGPIGAAIGGAVGNLIPGGSPPPGRPAMPGRAPAVPSPMPQPAPGGAPGNPAAAIAALLANPGFLQSILGSMFGAAGRESVTVGEHEVPVAAFENLHHMLAERVLESRQALSAPTAGVPRYLLDESGHYKADVSVPEQRAQVLWEMLLAETHDPGEYDDRGREWREYDDNDENEIDAYELARAWAGQ